MNRKTDSDKETNRIEQELFKDIHKAYMQALKEMRDKFGKQTREFAHLQKQKKRAVKEGRLSESAYKDWEQQELMATEWMRDMVSQLSSDCTNAAQKAGEAINEKLPEAYASGVNQSQYEIETGINTSLSFTLVNGAAVKAVAGNAKLYPTAKIKTGKEKRWNEKHIRSAIMQGILQGESIDKIAVRLRQVARMSESVARRMARTMVGTAQSIGHDNNARRARDEYGFDVKKIWIATVDTRTRASHRYLDLEEQPLDEPFSNTLMFPRDPDAFSSHPEEIYNCRCRCIHLPKDVPFDFSDRFTRLPEGMSYEEWKATKMAGSTPKGIVNGKDITSTWQRRPEEFAFEIDDVINAQGYDGLPKVVSEKEFNKYVKESGVICKRGYTAPNEASLNEYHNMLLHGKWYVDCSKGGASYGQGMYAVSTKGISLSKRMEDSVGRYGLFGQRNKATGAFGNIETFTLDKSTRSINSEKVFKERFEAIYDLKRSMIKEKMTPDEEKLFRLQSGIPLEPEELADIISNKADAKKVAEWTKEANRKAEKQVNEILRMDEGAVCALRGYDAIIVPQGDKDSYVVVLNRTKCIFLEDKNGIKKE